MDNNILATVGDVTITKEQMVGIIRNIPQEHQASVQGEEGRRRLLEEIIAGELLGLDAVDQKLDQEEGFIKILEEAKRGLLQRYSANKLFDSIEIKEEEIKAFYDENKAKFKTAEQINAKHILVKEEEEANKIKTEIEAGKTFEEAAKEYSTCPSKERGGDLGQFSKGQMVPEFEDAAFAAEIGALVGPVKTQFGYHLILVDKKLPEKINAFDEVEEAIKKQLKSMKQENVYFEKIAELKNQYSVEINNEALK